MNILTGAVIIILIWYGINGFQKGLVEGIRHLVSWGIGFAVLYVMLKGVGNFIEGSFVNVLIALMLLLIIHIIDRVLKLIMDSIKLVSRLPVIHGTDKLAGVVLGVVRGLCVIWILFIIVGFLESSELTVWIQQQVSGNDFLKLVYHSNVIVRALLYI